MARKNGKTSSKEDALSKQWCLEITNDLSADFSSFYAQNDRNGHRSRTPRHELYSRVAVGGLFTEGSALKSAAGLF